jgi:biotin carboxyl carrier protein
MPGTILEVLVTNGQVVEEGQDLLVVEAMKMEHRLKASHGGVVQGLQRKNGDPVGAGELLLEVIAPGEEVAPL